MKRIVLFGPESTGKSILAQSLANHYQTLYVPEFARAYLDINREVYDPFGRKNDEICLRQDIPQIVIGQIALEDAIACQSNKITFCDTNPLQTLVYNKYYFNSKEDWLENIIIHRHYDLYLLTDIDIPWIADHQRDRPDDRGLLFDVFQQELITRNLSYIKISGDYTLRNKNAIMLLNQWLETQSL